MIRETWACVELTRTRGWEERDRPDDDLTSVPSMLEWAEAAGVVDSRARAALSRRAREEPEAAREVLERARSLREALYRVLTAVAGDRDPPPPALERVNREIGRAGRHLRLTGGGREYDLELGVDARERLDLPLLRIARSAAELLTSPEVERLKLCDAHDCGWLFIDASRNRSRRWCDMAECGNRAKVRRYRERHGE